MVMPGWSPSLPDIEMNDTSSSAIKHCPSKQLRPYFFNTWFTDFFSKYYGRRREKNKNKNY